MRYININKLWKLVNSTPQEFLLNYKGEKHLQPNIFDDLPEKIWIDGKTYTQGNIIVHMVDHIEIPDNIKWVIFKDLLNSKKKRNWLLTIIYKLLTTIKQIKK